MPSSRTQRRRATRTAGRQGVPWPSWLPRCTGRCSPGPGLPREEGRRVLENVALLLESRVLASQSAQLLALGAGQPVIGALTAIALALTAPVPQRLRRPPQALSNVRDRAALTDQLQRLPPELLRISRPRLRHRCPSLPQLSPQALRTPQYRGNSSALFSKKWSTRIGGRLARAEQTTRVRIARDMLRRLRELTQAINELERDITTLVKQTAPQLLAEPGFGPLTAAKLVGEIAGAQRFATPAKLARVAGVAPIRASSGNTQRHRLDPGGNRQINAALHRVIVTRARCHQPTRDYLERRRREGKTTREAIRCLKRYLARHVWRLLQPPTPVQTGHYLHQFLDIEAAEPEVKLVDELDTCVGLRGCVVALDVLIVGDVRGWAPGPRPFVIDSRVLERDIAAPIVGEHDAELSIG